MTDAEIQHLANQLEYIKQYFANRIFLYSDYTDLGPDVEFKLVGEKRGLYIKQIRIYND
jgi:hypothetical protein